MPRDLDSTINLIRKLHEITIDNGATPAEAERAAGHAARLLAEHNLSLFDVSANTFDESVSEEERTYPSSVRHPWISDLAHYIGSSLECKVYLDRRWDDDADSAKVVITFVGHKSDAAVASYLWDTLSPVLYEMATNSGRSLGRNRADLVSYRNQFIRHAAIQIGKRLQLERTNAETIHEAETGESPSTAMILVKTAAVEEYISSSPKWSDAGTLPSSKASRDDYRAQADGYRAGKSIPIRKGLETSETSETKLLG